jgi:hypothetical protein
MSKSNFWKNARLSSVFDFTFSRNAGCPVVP